VVASESARSEIHLYLRHIAAMVTSEQNVPDGDKLIFYRPNEVDRPG